MHELNVGVHELNGGVHELNVGVHELNGGVHKLNGGVHELNGGVHERERHYHSKAFGILSFSRLSLIFCLCMSLKYLTKDVCTQRHLYCGSFDVY